MSCKLQNLFLWFYKVPGMPEGPRWLSWTFTNPGISCKLQNLFLWFFKVSWIARRSKIIFLKFGKSWNVLQASNYFSMILKSILDCQKFQDNFLEVLQDLECHASFQIFFYDFLKVSWTARRSKITFLKFDKSWNILQASK